MDPRDIAENTIYCFERFGEHVRGYDAFRLNGLLRVENYFLLRVLERERNLRLSSDLGMEIKTWTIRRGFFSYSRRIPQRFLRSNQSFKIFHRENMRTTWNASGFKYNTL